MKNQKSLMMAPFVVLGLGLSACGRATEQTDFQEAASQVGCSDFQSEVWNSLYKPLVNGEELPATRDLMAKMEIDFEKAHRSREFRALEPHMEKWFEFVHEAQNRIPHEKPLAVLTSMEVGVTVDSERKLLVSEFETLKTNLEKEIQASGISCNASSRAPETGEDGALATTTGSVAWGARKAIATAYQSCDVLDKSPMTSATADVKGISITGKHSSGSGNKREITDLAAVQKSHYYLQSSRPKSSCVNVNSSPMIYDFGGKPYVASSSSTELNFFKNDGSGTKALGIDCSGFVFSALATAGLKLDSSKTMKAVLVSGIPARAYMNPSSNGMSCLSHAKMGAVGSLQPGDIIASSGHIIIVERAGSDPLGLTKAKSVTECSKLTSSDFDFSVAQSSPSKNGIGINIYRAKDYLAESGTMRDGLVEMARAACKAYWSQKSEAVRSSLISVVRHSGTSSCKASKPIALTGQSCIAECPKLQRSPASL